MKGLIKKILREEIENDYSWVDNYLVEDDVYKIKDYVFKTMVETQSTNVDTDPGYVAYLNDKGKVIYADDIDTGETVPFLYVEPNIWTKVIDMGGNLNKYEIEDLFKEMFYLVFRRRVSRAVTAWWISSVYNKTPQ